MAKRCADMALSSRPRKTMRININSCRLRSMLPYIPDNVMFNIMLRLPSRSLIRFKCVCKAWYAMISSQFFVHAHLEQSKLKPSSVLMAPGFYKKQRNGQKFAFLMGLYKYQGNNIMQHLHDFPYDFPQILDTWSRPVHCNGLLFVSDMKDKMLIYNPSTTEVVSLPKGSPNLYKSRGHGFGFDNHSKKYKVTKVYYQRDYETSLVTCKCEVLALGTNEWRQMEDPPYPIGESSPVYVKGAIYWMVSRTSFHPEPPNSTLVRFCLTDERFSLLSCPCNVKPSCLTQVGDELYCGFFVSEGLSLEIWRCSFGQKPKWTQHCAIQIPPYAIKWHVASPVVAFHGKILLLALNKIYKYDTQTCKLERIPLTVEDFMCYDRENNMYQTYSKNVVMDFHLFNYVESLVSIREF